MSENLRLPWKLVDDDEVIVDADDCHAISHLPPRYNRFIVEACNNYEKLRERVEDLESLVDFAELSIDEAVEAGWDPPSCKGDE